MTRPQPARRQKGRAVPKVMWLVSYEESHVYARAFPYRFQAVQAQRDDEVFKTTITRVTVTPTPSRKER